MPDLVQRSLAGGELGPAVYGRADQVKYQTGLRTCRNAFVRRHGGVSNRTGSEMLVEVKDSTVAHRLLTFVFNAEQTYILLAGDQNLRMLRNGAPVEVSGVAAWSGSVNYVVADLVVYGGINYYCIEAHTGQVPPQATYWYPLDGTTYEIPTPYSVAELDELYIVQSGDVVSLDHPDVFPQELSRTGHTAWVMEDSNVTPTQDRPTAVSVAGGTVGAKTFRYRVTAVGDGTAEESLPALGPPKTISAITQANPCVVTSANHQNVNGDEVYLDGIVGMTSLNGRTFKVANVTSNTFQLSGVDSRTLAAYVSGGTAYRTSASTSTRAAATNITAATQALPCQITSVGHGLTTGDTVYIESVVGMVELNGGSFTVTVTDVDHVYLDGIDSSAYTAYASGGTIQDLTVATAGDPTASAPHVISWTETEGAVEYNIYKEKDGNGVYGYIGSAVGTTFNDTNIEPDMDLSPPQTAQVFASAGNYPGTVGYYDQRRIHGNTTNEPEKVFASRSGKFSNFTISSPSQQDDAVFFTIAGRQVNAVRHLIDIGNLVILTAGGEWVAYGNAEGALTPGSPGLKQVGSNGAAAVPPIIIGNNNLLFLQARGSLVRDFRTVVSNDGTTGFSGDDLTVFAPHLFEGHSIVRWAFGQIPHSIIWAVRDDGVLLGLTYIKAHEIFGWHRHDTDGFYEDVAVVPEGDEDMVYVIVRRTIEGQPRRYVERFPSRRVTDVAIDARFMDSYKSYNGWHTGSTTMTLSGGTTWAYTETLTLMASADVFSAGDRGNAIELVVESTVWNAEAGFVTTRATLTCNILTYSSPTVVLVNTNRDVPVAFRGVAIAEWGLAVDEVSGLDHLEGKTVAVIGDGHVVSNGLDAPAITVSGGTITLGRPAVVIHAGLPYVTDIELLDMEVTQTETISPKQKRVNSVTLQVEASRGVFMGPDAAHLRELKPTDIEPGTAQGLVTGKIEMNIKATWNNSGRVLIRQRNPLPLTVLAVMPHADIGG